MIAPHRLYGSGDPACGARLLPSVPAPNGSLLCSFAQSSEHLPRGAHRSKSAPSGTGARRAGARRDAGMGGEATVDTARERMSTGGRHRRKGGGWGGGLLRMLTDDPGKETKLHGLVSRQGPRGPGKTDPWQVRSLEKHLWHSRWLRQELQPSPSQIKINTEQSK